MRTKGVLRKTPLLLALSVRPSEVRLAKQMINNADVVLRSVKFVADYKLEDSTVKDMVTGKYLLMKKGDDGTIEGKTL